MESLHDLEVLLDCKKSNLIVIETEREGCFIEGFNRIAARSHLAFFHWTVTKGLIRLGSGYTHQSHNRDINQLFAQIQSTNFPSVYVLVDFHHFLTDPVAIRHVKDALVNNPEHTIVMLSSSVELPEDLRNRAVHYELPLPAQSELKAMVNDLAERWYQENNVRVTSTNKRIAKRLIENLCGLSIKDAKRLAEHAIFNDGVINQQDIAEINQEKFDLLNKNNVLSYELDFEELDNIAGFENLKEWLEIRRKVFSGELKLPGNDIPKGMLLLGVQGCGKSLAAKAVAGSWHLPLLYLDFGTLYNRFIGQTEENMRSVLEVAEHMSPCVLWMDEIEKGLSAVSNNDDISKRLLGTFLTWLAENKSKVFVVATANDVTALPPELMRKGRFDEVFFVDLPTLSEREEILKVHLRRRDLSTKGLNLMQVAEACDGFSGAEIEQVIVSAIYSTYAKETKLSTDDLLKEVDRTRPLSVLMAEKIHGLRAWAEHRAVKV